MSAPAQAETTARTLDVLTRHFGFTDAAFAAVVGHGYSRETIRGRRAGRKAVDTAELQLFADALGIPTFVLLMEPVEALRWVLDNVPGGGLPDSSERQAKRRHNVFDLPVSQSPCMHDRPALRVVRPRLVAVRPSAA